MTQKCIFERKIKTVCIVESNFSKTIIIIHVGIHIEKNLKKDSPNS